MAPHRHPFAPLALVTLTLAACGGGGSDDAPGSGGGGGGSSGTAVVAGITKVDMPSGAGSRTPDARSLRATNDGVYLALTGSSVATMIVKRTVGRGGTPAGWITSTLPATGSWTYTPLTITTEGPNEFTYRWKAGDRYGISGGVNSNYLDDLYIRQIVPDGPYSTSAREWVLNGSAVYRKSTGGGLGTNAAVSYTRVVNLSDSYLGETASASDGAGTLYAASGDTLYQIGATGSLTAYDFSSLGFGNIHTLIYRHGRLWVGYANQILFLQGGTVSSFATIANTFTPTSTTPRFCISNITLYASDGTAYQGIDYPSPASKHNYLQSGDNVASSDAMKLGEVKSAVGAAGVYCSDSTNGWGPYVYSLGMDISSGAQKLFVITPL